MPGSTSKHISTAKKNGILQTPNRNITYMQYQNYLAKSILNAHAWYVWEYNIDYPLSTTRAKEKGQPKWCFVELFERFIHLHTFSGNHLWKRPNYVWLNALSALYIITFKRNKNINHFIPNEVKGT